MTRPIIRKVTVPAGEIAISNEPRMLRARPKKVIFKRPSRSASPPATTMKMPENRAVMLTAILFRLSLIPNSSRIVGATFSVVCAKSQKVMTARTMPTMSLLAPRCVSDEMAVEGNGGTSLHEISQSGNDECLGTGGQRRFNHWGKELRVIDGDVLLHPPGIESALIPLWINTADSPVGVGSFEGIGYVAEVFARGQTSEVEDGFVSEVAAERGRDLIRHFKVIVRERVLIEIIEVWWTRRAGRFTLGSDHPFDAVDHSLAHAHVVSPQID